MFQPRGVAVLGASADPQKPGGQALKALVINGFSGGIHPVNPRHQELRGLPCFASVAEITGPVDLALIALPAHLVAGALRECAAAGIKHVVVISSGFAEAGPQGAAWQEDLATIARSHGLALVGPNCLGVISAPNRLTANFLLLRLPQDLPRPNQISIVSQSGSLAAQLVHLLAERGVGICRLISSGNEAVLDFADHLAWLVADPATPIIAGYLEGLREPARLQAALEAAHTAGKPVLILSAGRGPQAAQAASRHTGNPPVEPAIIQQLLEQGHARVFNDLDQLCAAAAMAATAKPAAGGGVAVLSPFGGAGVLLCDLLHEQGIPLATLSTATSARLADLLPPYASSLNPIDLTPQVMARGDLIAQCAQAVLADPASALLIVCSWIWPEYEAVQADLLGQLSQSSAKPVLHLIWGPPDSARQTRRLLHERGIPAESEAGKLVLGIKVLSGL
jgi:acetyltransferase